MKRMRQSHTKPASKSAGHGMGGMFGATPKKPEADAKPKTRAEERSKRAARLKDLKI